MWIRARLISLDAIQIRIGVDEAFITEDGISSRWGHALDLTNISKKH